MCSERRPFRSKSARCHISDAELRNPPRTSDATNFDAGCGDHPGARNPDVPAALNWSRKRSASRSDRASEPTARSLNSRRRDRRLRKAIRRSPRSEADIGDGQVESVDAHFARARRHGARIVQEPEDFLMASASTPASIRRVTHGRFRNDRRRRARRLGGELVSSQPARGQLPTQEFQCIVRRRPPAPPGQEVRVVAREKERRLTDVVGRRKAAERHGRLEGGALLGRVLAHEHGQERRLAGDGASAQTRILSGASSTAIDSSSHAPRPSRHRRRSSRARRSAAVDPILTKTLLPSSACAG